MTTRRSILERTPLAAAAQAFRVGDDLAELVSESVIVFDLKGEIRSWNGGAQALYGWDRDAAVGRTMADLLVSPPYVADANALARLRPSGRWAGRAHRITRAGEPIVVKLRWTARIGADGAPDAIVEVGSAEATGTTPDGVRISEERYRQLFDRAPVALMLVDARRLHDVLADLRLAGVTDLDAHIDDHPEFVQQALDSVGVAEANEAAVRIYAARDASELIGPVGLVWREAPDTFRRVMVARFADQPDFVEETRIRTLDGRKVDVLLSVAFPSEHEFMGASLMGMLDITARLHTEARLRKVTADFERAARVSTLGGLTASIAHEVKQPLSAILTNAQTTQRWLSRDVPNVEKASALAVRIADSAQRASAIIGRIQDMTGIHAPAPVSLDLNEVVQEALHFVGPESDDQAVTIQVTLQPNLPRVRGDRVQLQQVMVNLLINSIQAMKPYGLERRDVLLRTTSDVADGVVLSIEDTGPGIADDHIDRIFEGFFTTKADGMGIGLAICQSIINAHGGRITASNRPGGGAMFRFSIPIEGAGVGGPEHHLAE